MNIEEHIEGLKSLKPFLQELMLNKNYGGMGEQHSKEIGEMIDLSTGALEKQIPKKPKLVEFNDLPQKEIVAYCPTCGYSQGEIHPNPGSMIRQKRLPKFCHGDDERYVGHCDACGQAIDFRYEETEK